MKSVQIRSYFWSVFRPNTGNYEPEITPYLDTFHVVNFFCVYMRSTKRNVSDMTKLVYKKGGFWEAAQRPCHGAGGGGGEGLGGVLETSMREYTETNEIYLHRRKKN